MSNSWKKYGGTQNLAKNDSITTRILVTDELVLRNAYTGTFTIDGGLAVSDDATFGKDVDISGNLNASKLNITSGFVLNDLSINGNLEVLDNAVIRGNLDLNDTLYFGQGADSYLYGNQTEQLLGLNTPNPQSTLDIAGDTVSVLNVYSSQPTNRNIIARNQNNRGIVVQATDTSSSIQFYNDTLISATGEPDAEIKYTAGGTIEVDASNTQIYSRVAISPNTDANHINNETAVIYDISSGKYLFNIYNNENENTGNALTLVATDTSSITFLNISTPNKKGINIGGGAYPNDPSRTLGTLGYTDSANNYVPVQNIVSGTSKVKLRSTTGFNTFSPRTETYAVDINGPIHVANGQVTPVIDSSFQILETNFSQTSPLFGISVGTPSAITSPYTQNILYSANGGESWNLTNINSGDLEDVANNFNTIYCFDSTFSFLGGSLGFFYYTNNGGVSWKNITIVNLTTISSIYATTSPSVAGLRVFFLTNPPTGATISYFDVLYTTLATGNTITPTRTTLLDTVNFKSVRKVNGFGSFIYVLGINNSDNDVVAKYTVNLTSPTYTSPNAQYNFNGIYTLDANYIIAVGTGSIYTTINGGVSWSNNTTISEKINAIYIYDTLRAVATGDGGLFIYSEDGFQTWRSVPIEIINASGNAINLQSYNLISISMVDINTVVITATLANYTNGGSNGASRQFYVFIPYLFNRQNTSVLDISGSTYISGDLHVNDGGGLYSNDVSFSLINTGVQTVYFGGGATDIRIGNTTGNTRVNNNLVVSGQTLVQDISANGNLGIGGNTTISGNLVALGKTTLQDISGNGNFSINGITLFKNTTNATALNTGSVQLSGGVSIAGNAYLGDTLQTSTIQPATANTISVGAGLSNIINIGNIGNPSSLFSDTINIGGTYDFVNIGGNITSTAVNNLVVTNKTITLNAGSITNNSSAESGIKINDNNNVNAGYILVDLSLNGYIFKAPNSNNALVTNGNINNVVDLNVNSLITPLNSAILMLQPSTTTDSSYVINPSSVDVSNILLRSATLSSNTEQVITTNVRVNGNLSFTGATGHNLYIGGNTVLNSANISTLGFTGATGQNLYIGGNTVLNSANVSTLGFTGATGDTLYVNNATIENITINTANIPTVNASNITFTGATGQNISVLTANITSLPICGPFSADNQSIAIGVGAGTNLQGGNSVAIGVGAGQNNQAGAVAIGALAGQTGQKIGSVAIGALAGQIQQGVDSVAVGQSAGRVNQSTNSVAIGNITGDVNQGSGSIAVGFFAGRRNQGSSSVAIGQFAGQTNQPANTIILNASGSIVNGSTGSSTYINPIRIQPPTQNNNLLSYNSSSSEINRTPNTTLDGSGNITTTGNLTVDGTSFLSTVSFTGATGQNLYVTNATISNLSLSSINVPSVNTSTLTFTGATGQNLYITSQANMNTINTSTLSFTGATGQNLYISGNSVLNTATISTLTFTGATGQNLYISGNSVLNTATIPTLTFTGATGQTISVLTANITSLPICGPLSATNQSIAIGSLAGTNNQGTSSVAIGFGAGQTGQNSSSVSIGQEAGRTQQGTNATAIGSFAGGLNQSNNTVAIGSIAGATNQGLNCVAVGYFAGQVNQSNSAVSIGSEAGRYSQNLSSVAIGSAAGQHVQSFSSVAIGPNAGQTGQSSGSVAIGSQAGLISQGSTSVAIGGQAGQNNQSLSAVSMGNLAGQISQGQNSVSIGLSAGRFLQSSSCVAIGPNAGQTGQGSNAVGIGSQAGQVSQGGQSIAIGQLAGTFNQGLNSVAIGVSAGSNVQGTSAVAIGNGAGQTGQGGSSVSIGIQAGQISQNINSVAIGLSAGRFLQSSTCVAIGANAGVTGQNSNSIAIGSLAGQVSQGSSSVAIGAPCASNNQGANSVAIGPSAGLNIQGASAVAIGNGAGQTGQGANGVAIGLNAGQISQSTNSVAIGQGAGQTGQGVECVAIGLFAGRTQQRTGGIAIGTNAGSINQGTGAIAIGQNAGQTNQPANSIVINASTTAISGATGLSMYVSPIRAQPTQVNNVLSYNTTSFEVNSTSATVDGSGNFNLNTVGLSYISIPALALNQLGGGATETFTNSLLTANSATDSSVTTGIALPLGRFYAFYNLTLINNSGTNTTVTYTNLRFGISSGSGSPASSPALVSVGKYQITTTSNANFYSGFILDVSPAATYNLFVFGASTATVGQYLATGYMSFFRIG